MAFESVDVGALTSSISNCEASLENSKLKTVSSSISTDSWLTASRDNLSIAITKLGAVRYTELKNILSICTKVANLISKYKELEQENENLEQEIGDLNQRLWSTETKKVGKKTVTYQAKNYWVAAQIVMKQNKINQNIIQMDRIEKQVAGLV